MAHPRHATGAVLALALLVASAALNTMSSAAAASATHPNGTGVTLPANGKIAFVRSNQIYTANSTGTGVKALTSGDRNFAPAYSRDGTQIAYIHKVNGKQDLWIMKSDGTAKKRITTTGTVNGLAWSPDGQWLAFGSPLQEVRTVAPYDVHPILGTYCSSGPVPLDPLGHLAWSPNGQYIVFPTYEGCDSPSYYFVSLDLATGNVVDLAEVGGACCGYGYYENPAFSSDSKLLAYDYVWQTNPTNPLGPPAVQLTTFPSQGAVSYPPHPSDTQPVFAPNDQYLLFANYATGIGKIWRADLNGTHRTLITTGYDPTWQPLP